METVMLDGNEYTKASSVAKRYGYTADYLGQLCRGKKIDARVIGRSWYVNVSSLEKHRSQKYSSIRKETSQPKVEVLSVTDNSGIEPKQYIKRVQMPLRGVHKGAVWTKLVDTEPSEVSYVGDEAELLPKLTKSSASTRLHIEPAGAEKVSIKSSQSNHSILKPEPLPEVYLKGSLSIVDAQDKEEDIYKKSESRDNQENKAKVEETEHIEVEQKTPRALKVTIKKLSLSQGATLIENKNVRGSDKSPNSPKPALAQAEPVYQVAIKNLEVSPEGGSTIPITVMVCSAVAMSVLLLSIENVITVTGSGMISTLSVQASVLMAFFSL